jgi:hypothetical protein
LLNPFEIIRENTDKRYLLKLEERGVPIVPMVVVENIEIEPNLYLSENEQGLKLLIQETLKRI